MVIGGGVEQYSTQSRVEEWNMALPHILSRPIFGYGFSLGTDVVGYGSNTQGLSTLDSSLITTLVDTGIIGFTCFFGMIIVAIRSLILNFTFAKEEERGLIAAICASLVAYLTDRMVLSQVDNQIIFFGLIGISLVIDVNVRNCRDKS